MSGTETEQPGVVPENGQSLDGPTLESQLAEAEGRAEQHRADYLRAIAELENFRKRSAREVDAARQFGVERFAADLLSVGEAGSQAVTIAKDLLHLTDVKILHGQDAAVAAELETLLGLGPIARDLVTGWAMNGKGRGLWCLGEQAYKVQTVLHPAELEIAFTNDALSGAA